MNPLPQPRVLLGSFACLVMLACAQPDRDERGGSPISTPTPSGTSTNDPPVETPSCTPGETRSCKNKVEAGSGIIACVVGVERCDADGNWGPCEASLLATPGGGSEGGGTPGGSGEEGSQFQLTAATAQSCTNNACDANCKVFNEATPVTNPQTTSSGAGQVSSLPGGFQNKGLKDSNHPPNPPCDSVDDCQYDHYCDIPTGLCKPWANGAYKAGTTKPDYTMKVPCGGVVSVCNRGAVTAPSGSKVTVVNGNSSQLQGNLGKCSGLSGSSAGQCTLSSSIAPGACVAVSGCSSYLSGTKGLVVNSSSFSGTVNPETECSNNWSVAQGSGACGTAYTIYEHRVTYTATCSGSKKPRWTFLAYNASLPQNSSGAASMTVEVEASTSPSSLNPLCTNCTTIATAPTSDPAICSMGGPTPCPKKLGTTLGQAAAAPYLQVLFTLNPTPDGGLPATLNSWEVSYTCVDDQ